MYIDRSSCKVGYPIFLSDFNEQRIFPTDFRKILKYEMSWKSVQWELSYSVRMDGDKTRMTKLIVASSNFENTPEIGKKKGLTKCGAVPSYEVSSTSSAVMTLLLVDRRTVSGWMLRCYRDDGDDDDYGSFFFSSSPFSLPVRRTAHFTQLYILEPTYPVVS
jgi:hypothetical protein